MTSLKHILTLVGLVTPFGCFAATTSVTDIYPLKQQLWSNASSFYYEPGMTGGEYISNIGQTDTALLNNTNHLGLHGEPTSVGEHWKLVVNAGEQVSVKFVASVSDYFLPSVYNPIPTGRGNFSVQPSVAGLQTIAPVTSAVLDGVYGRTFTVEYAYNNLPAGSYNFDIRGNRVWGYQVTTSVTSAASLSSVKLLNCVFDWAEQAYADLYAPAGTASQVLFPYTYRYYPNKGRYLGWSAQTNHVYYLNQGGSQVDVGLLADFLFISNCVQ